MTALPLQWLEVRRHDLVFGPHGPALVLDVYPIEGDELRVFWTRGDAAGFIDVDPWDIVPVEPQRDPMAAAIMTIYQAFPTTQVTTQIVG